METTLVIVNGFPRSGKDEFTDMAMKILTDAKFTAIKYSTITTCMEAATVLGWDGTKTPAMRMMLSELKDLYTRYFNGTYYEMVRLMMEVKTLNDTPAGVIFAMVREPEEIKKISQWCHTNNVRVISVGITGRGESNHESHSDKNVYRYKYDVMINNDGDLAALNNMAHNFVTNELGMDLFYSVSDKKELTKGSRPVLI